jgi:hypothetical protein
MLEKMSRVAERVATSASRRQFLGRLGRGAMGVAAAVAGLLAIPSTADAAPRACGAGSAGYCLGKKQGDRCRVGRYSGICLAAPLCYCRISGSPR